MDRRNPIAILGMAVLVVCLHGAQDDSLDARLLTADRLRMQGKYVESERLYLECVKQAEKPANHGSKLATALNNLAVVHHALAHYADAEKAYQRAVAIWERYEGAESAAVASALNNWGELCRTMGRLSQAEQLHRRALAIRQRLPDAEIAVASSLNAMAVMSLDLTRYDDAVAFAKEAIAIQEAKSGHDSMQVSTPLGNLAEVYRVTGRMDLAGPLFARVVEIRSKRAKPDSEDLALALSNYGSFLKDAGDGPAAGALFRRALEIREKAFGPDHPLVALTQSNLSSQLIEDGKLDEAEVLLRKSIETLDKYPRAQARHRASALNNLGLLESKRDHLAEADSLYRRALESSEAAGPAGLQTSVILRNLGNLALTQKKLRSADQYFHKALAIRESTLKPGDPAIGETLQDLGLVRSLQGRKTEAGAFYRRANALLPRPGVRPE